MYWIFKCKPNGYWFVFHARPDLVHDLLQCSRRYRHLLTQELGLHAITYNLSAVAAHNVLRLYGDNSLFRNCFNTFKPASASGKCVLPEGVSLEIPDLALARVHLSDPMIEFTWPRDPKFFFKALAPFGQVRTDNIQCVLLENDAATMLDG